MKLRNFFGFFKLFCNKTRATNVIIYIRQFYAKWGKDMQKRRKGIVAVMVPALLLAAAVSASCAWKNPRISGSMSVIVRYPFKIPFKFDFSGSFAAGRIVCGKREHYLNVTKNIAKQTALVRLCPFVPY